jgi:hypothetical protein
MYVDWGDDYVHIYGIDEAMSKIEYGLAYLTFTGQMDHPIWKDVESLLGYPICLGSHCKVTPEYIHIDLANDMILMSVKSLYIDVWMRLLQTIDELMSNVPKMADSESQEDTGGAHECVICWEKEETYWMKCPHGHSVHMLCYYKWIRNFQLQTYTCSVCRQTMSCSVYRRV